MGVLLVITTLITCLFAVKRPWAAAALLIVLLPLEQVLQGYFVFLRYGSASSLVNVVIGVVALISWLHSRLVAPTSTTLLQCKVLLISAALLAWSFVTCAWSPSSENALDIITKGFPYYVAVVVVGSQLISTLPDLRRCLYLVLLLGILINVSFLLNPEFTFRDGRLGFDFGGGYRSSSLAIGESGAIAMIIAVVMREADSKRFLWLVRSAGALLGAVVLIMSGARGQLIAGALVSAAFYPLATSQRNIQRTIWSVCLITLFLVAGWFIFESVLSMLPTFASTRFSSQEILYGASSASGRIGNVNALFSAWLQSPLAPFVGLGYLAFGSVTGGSALEEYCHNVYAEVIFELGIPGVVCMAGAIYMGMKSAIRLYKSSTLEPSNLTTAAMILALIVYEAILLAKQGSLWGSYMFFFYLCTADRIQRENETNLVNGIQA